MNILIKWIFKAEQAFYATTIRFFPTLAINQGLLSDWDDSRLTSELNRTTFDEEVCQEPWYRDLHAKAKLLKPACNPGKEKAPVSGAATPEG